MLIVSLFILISFLLVRAIIGAVQRYLEGRARGAAFKRMIRQGRIEAGVYDQARWGDDRGSSAKRRFSREQRAAIARARLEMREDFLSDNDPGFYQYVILFLIASVLGLVIETIYTFVMFGVFESRVGLVWGPFSPLYGVGAVLLTMVLWPMRNEPAWKLFLLSAVLGGTLEQFAGWSLEHFAHAQSWTYLGLPDHITQWIAWRFLVAWGILGIVWCRAIMPEVIFRIGEPTTRRQVIVVSLLTVFLALDIVMTVTCFWRAGQRLEGVPPQNALERYVDNHFDDAFMRETFENMRVGEDLEPADR